MLGRFPFPVLETPAGLALQVSWFLCSLEVSCLCRGGAAACPLAAPRGAGRTTLADALSAAWEGRPLPQHKSISKYAPSLFSFRCFEPTSLLIQPMAMSLHLAS